MQKKTYWFLLFLILIIATFFRVWHISQIPPSLYPDEATNANNALEAVKTGDYKIFYVDNNGREGLFINLMALSFKYFGVGIWQSKLPSMAIGILTVLAVAFLCFWLFKGKKAYLVSLLSSFLVAISVWHINFSRIAFRAIAVPLLITASLAFIYWGLRKKNAWGFALAGILFGLGFHTYIAFRVAPVILAVPLVFDIFKFSQKKYKGWWKTFFEERLWRWVVFTIFAIVTVFPIAKYFYQHPEYFMGRSTQVSVLTSASPLKAAAWSLIKTLGEFNVYGDSNWRHNLSGQPLLSYPVGLLFLLGLGWCLVSIFSPKLYRQGKLKRLEYSWLLLVWWGIMLAPAFLTNEGVPHALRSIGSLVPSCILAALGFWLLLSWVKKFQSKKTQTALFTVLILVLISFLPVSFSQYFIIWGQNKEVAGAFNQSYRFLAETIKNRPQGERKIIIANENGVPVPYPDGVSVAAQSTMFLSYPAPNQEYLKRDDWQNLRLNKNQPTSIFLLTDDNQVWQKLQKKFGGDLKREGEIKYLTIK